jgi:arsenate reductase
VRIITMGCDVDASACPANYYVTEDWGLEDPKDKPLETVRGIRDQIEERIRRLIEELKDG